MNADPNNLNVATEVEPVSEPTVVPMWLIMALLVLLFLGAWYFDARGGWLFNAKVYTPYAHTPEEFGPPPLDGPDPKRGRVLFEQHCAVCHNNDGAGKPGQAPPLAGSEWVNAKGVNRLIRIPLLGLTGSITVKGQKYDGLSMVGLGGGLTDKDVSDILSYVRTNFGNTAPVVTEDQVKKVRDELGSRSLQYTVDEILKLEE